MTNNEQENAEQNVFKEETEKNPTKKNVTMSGLDENIAGLLSYIVIIGVIFLFVEKENRFIRFHALQAIFTFATIFLIMIIIGIIPFVGLIISVLLAPVGLFLMVFLMYQAFQGKMFKLPFVGDLAEKYSIPQ